MTMGKIRLLAEAATIISFENLEAFSLRFHKGKKRASNNFSVFDIEMALENGGGRWRKFPADSFNSRLRDKYLVIPNAKGKAIKNTRTYQQWASAHRKFLLGEILLDGRKIESDYMRVIDHSACQLSMGLVLHPHFDIKKDKNPSLDDPLSIVRSFLRFIGVYLETRGSGSSTSKIRDASPRYKAVLKDLRQYMVRSNVIAGKIPLPVIRRLFKKHYPNPPTDDQITKIIEDLPKIFPKEQAE
ncbi:MAG: hypothetical protein HYZ85_04250 [Candidatus Omnitrophica bacterium]|nr:hypothetical protein [Candidatus Omnitrophota bacterium]